MTPAEEIERFFSAYSDASREWVESYSEYQLALKRGKTTTALEIAAVILSDFTTKQRNDGIAKIFKKEFPELSN